jgi:hypothetical protein
MDRRYVGMRVVENLLGSSELQMERDVCIGNRDKTDRCAAARGTCWKSRKLRDVTQAPLDGIRHSNMPCCNIVLLRLSCE